MKRIYLLISTALVLLSGISCKKNDNSSTPEASKYYVLDVKNNPSVGKKLLSVDSYQQTTEYTCGPASVLTLMKYYGFTGDEMTIAGEMGTSTTTGTNPEQMTTWMNAHGFNASWHQEGSLEMLRENLVNNIPTLLEWSDWGGHWVLVIGYDTRNNTDGTDDVIIFADPYDHHDDNPDGLTWFNADRFYYMWYDALLFGTVMKRVYISAIPIMQPK